ncbi:conserved unknown protein [Ectocarpus siliculosus]|uniref:Uncharacterized protein n=1 Tax=Ectocarpus siliculosus TaxID=2880 RepID=D8LM90_ECTSI|nr:conserved unknown protein [Ectocarpus siliculosus]|eukprot:CBN77500.1 conserved unknown protein [Ectocarpus siliculosus]
MGLPSNNNTGHGHDVSPCGGQRGLADYHAGREDESKALFVGNALVKGYKAFLDVKQKGWREYVEEPGPPLVNPVVVPSGCAEHANIYAIYAVDSRQVLNALLMEPRFLSMTPDTGLVDLTAEETGRFVRTLVSVVVVEVVVVVRRFSWTTHEPKSRHSDACCCRFQSCFVPPPRHQASVEGKSDLESAAFLLVTGVWAPGGLIESPVLYTKEDGTKVTDYPRSLALWAGTTDGARLDDDDAERQQYWASFRQAIRQAEHRLGQQQEQRDAFVQATEQEEEAQRADDGFGDVTTAARPVSECRSQARYGSGPDMVRMGKEYTAGELLQIVPQVFGVRPAAGSQEL